MKSSVKFYLLFSLFLLGTILSFVTHSRAQGVSPSGEDIVNGALLYDKWYAALKVNPPANDMLIWSRQSTNTRSGPDTWRCVECHGWDYKGLEGAYGSGSHFTGFPNIMKLVGQMSEEEIVAHLKGAKDPAHDFSPYIPEASLSQLAVFLKYGLIDDTAYIDGISLKVIGGNETHGGQLFQQTCSTCHGEDGKTIIFHSEGVNEYLGTLANRDPWRFLHRTRFGTAGTTMPVGFNLGWTPEDGRDILAYAQTLPTGGEIPVVEPTTRPEVTPTKLPGGPATNLFTGILTGLGAFVGVIGYALLFTFGFILAGFLVVTVLRRRKE